MALASLVIPARSAARRTIRPRRADLGAARQDKEDRPVGAFPGGQVDRPGGAGRKRDGDGLAALIRTTGSASGRLGTWWPPAGEHSSAQDFESFRKSVPLPVTRES